MSPYPPVEVTDRWEVPLTIYIPPLVSLAVAAIGLFMCLHSFSLYLGHPIDERNGRGRYVVVSAILVILSWITAIAQLIDGYVILLDLSPSFDDMEEILERHSPMSSLLLQITPFMMTRWIGDILLVYRCYIIWQDRPLVASLPILTFLVSFGLSIPTSFPLYDWSPVRNIVFISVDGILYMVLHVLITVLITVRLLSARRTLIQVLGAQDDKVYTRVIAMLVESAAAITIVAIPLSVANIAAFDSWPASQVNNIFSLAYTIVVTLAPQFIIFRVSIGRSWVKRPGITSSTALSREIQFAKSNSSGSSDGPRGQ
ncbi:hypothetical protein CC2G_014469 [Coprinopsis cinerea AmutBmut pab1-1]|nr:hypothetical protein CC2G_014469 [Coprinopsis cinerea AmutBmut pab1-1]